MVVSAAFGSDLSIKEGSAAGVGDRFGSALRTGGTVRAGKAVLWLQKNDAGMVAAFRQIFFADMVFSLYIFFGVYERCVPVDCLSAAIPAVGRALGAAALLVSGNFLCEAGSGYPQYIFKTKTPLYGRN